MTPAEPPNPAPLPDPAADRADLRASQRPRRIIDALRILPLVGLWLWLLPVLWPREEAGGVQGAAMSTTLIYIFLVWSGLVIASALLVRAQGAADAGRPRSALE